MKMDNLKYQVYKLVDRFFQGTNQHFQCQLPEKPGIFWQFVMRRLYAGIQFIPDQAQIVKDLPEDAIVVYVNKFKSNFEFLFSYIRFPEQLLEHFVRVHKHQPSHHSLTMMLFDRTCSYSQQQ